MSKREWNTPIREPWNPVIKHVLKAIDEHNNLYFKTGDPWHLQKASDLRHYIKDLKDWIKQKEN